MKSAKNKGATLAVGRPRKDLTPELEAKILGGFRAGHYHASVAAQAEMSESHLYDLMRENPEFMDRVKAACVVAEESALLAITTGESSWQSRAWFLERRYPRWRSPDTKLKEKMGHAPAPQVPTLPVKKTRQELLDELDLLDSQLPALAHDEAKRFKE